MVALWSNLRTWFGRGRPLRLENARLLQQVAIARDRTGSRKADASQAASPDAQCLAEFILAAETELGQSPFDVQLVTAAAMADGKAVEMQTGEGKSLATAAAAALLARRRRRVHVATVNHYLAHRDFDRFSPVLVRLGITVGLIHEGQSPAAKRAAYASDVVYGTGYEFGFDYLREQLRRLRGRTPKLGERYRNVGSPEAAPLQPTLDFMLVDELDSVLLDEACVPLILSEPVADKKDNLAAFARAEEVSLELLERRLAVIEGPTRSVRLMDAAHEVIGRTLPQGEGLRLQRPWRQYVEHALTAAALLQRDADYVVADQKIWLVDAATGRIFPDRRWVEGLQHAVEFKERLPLSQPTQSSARITRQRFFRLYRQLGGTSGTLFEAADEIERSYGTPVCIIGPRLPSQRQEWPTRYFVRHLDRLRAAAAEAVAAVRSGRPVLVGCRTITAAREAAQVFNSLQLTPRLLDGTQPEDEARVVARAGTAGTVTIATNIAGRGTDIMLDATARRSGGLHVIGIERHDSARVDRQLLGRAGRQGDPGSGRFFVSADDALLQPYPWTRAAFQRPTDENGELSALPESIVRECQRSHEAEARLRRGETAAADAVLDDLLVALSKPE